MHIASAAKIVRIFFTVLTSFAESILLRQFYKFFAPLSLGKY